jgi:hypothetical protein
LIRSIQARRNVQFSMFNNQFSRKAEPGFDEVVWEGTLFYTGKTDRYYISTFHPLRGEIDYAYDSNENNG